MLRVGEDLVDRPALDDPAGVHHGDLVDHLRDDAEVVRDRAGSPCRARSRSSRISSRICAWIGHVERRRRLVGDQELRVAARAPSRSSRAGACRRTAGADSRRAAARRRGCRRARASRSPGCERPPSGRRSWWSAHRLGDLVADREDRVERGHRLLEDHRDVVAADLSQLVARRASSRSRPSNTIVRPSSIRPGAVDEAA